MSDGIPRKFAANFLARPRLLKFSVPELVIADLVFKLQNARHKTQITRDKGRNPVNRLKKKKMIEVDYSQLFYFSYIS